MTPIGAPITTVGGSKEVDTSLPQPYRPPDYAVVIRVPVRFGDGPLGELEVNVDTSVPRVGPFGEFRFFCPGVDSSQEALLQFEHRGSDQALVVPDPQPGGGWAGISREHPVAINGLALPGGIPAAPKRDWMPLWSNRLLIIPPGVLMDDNILRIESGDTGLGYLDDFTIANVVVFFKTRPPPAVTPPAEAQLHTVYANQGGSDVHGHGTREQPYRTFQRAVRDVPAVLAPGTRWIVDITDLGVETLPPGYVLPPWKCADIFEPVNNDPFWVGFAGVNIQATPRVLDQIKGDEILRIEPDPVTRLMKITLVAGRTLGNSHRLKGRFFIAGGVQSTVNHSGDHCVIWDAGPDYLRVTNIPATPAQLNAPFTPFDIVEPSAHLVGTSTDLFRGALNAINCDSIAFNGIGITSGGTGPGLFAQGYGEVITQLCQLESPNVATLGTFINRIQRSWVHGAPALWGRFVVNQGLFSECTTTPIRGPAVPQFRRTVFLACATLEVADQLFQTGVVPTTVSYFRMDNCLFRGDADALTHRTLDGLVWHGAKGLLNQVDISYCERDCIRCEAGTGILELQNVRTTHPAKKGTGLRVADGMWVRVDDATSLPDDGKSQPLSGILGDMIVASASRSWDKFRSGTDGRPAQNEWDITAATTTGATGSGSRVYA